MTPSVDSGERVRPQGRWQQVRRGEEIGMPGPPPSPRSTPATPRAMFLHPDKREGSNRGAKPIRIRKGRYAWGGRSIRDTGPVGRTIPVDSREPTTGNSRRVAEAAVTHHRSSSGPACDAGVVGAGPSGNWRQEGPSQGREGIEFPASLSPARVGDESPDVAWSNIARSSR